MPTKRGSHELLQARNGKAEGCRGVPRGPRRRRLRPGGCPQDSGRRLDVTGRLRPHRSGTRPRAIPNAPTKEVNEIVHQRASPKVLPAPQAARQAETGSESCRRTAGARDGARCCQQGTPMRWLRWLGNRDWIWMPPIYLLRETMEWLEMLVPPVGRALKRRWYRRAA